MLVDDVVVPHGDYRHSGKPSVRLVIVRRWFLWPVAVGLTAMCIVANAEFFADYGRSKAPLALGLFHVCVGGLLGYLTLAQIVNRTRVAVENGMLSVRHRPLPWIRNRMMALDTIEHFACEEVVGRKGSRSYKVVATLRTGARLALLDQLPDAEQARFISDLLSARAITENA